MNTVVDVFANDAFGVLEITDFINQLKHKPGRIGEMGLFTAHPVTTTRIAIERIGDLLQLVSPSPRGGPGEVRDMPKRSANDFSIPHFQRDYAVYADEVQNVRGRGLDGGLETVKNVVGYKIAAQLNDFDLTEEHARLGALTGVVTYADSTRLNLFDEFGVDEVTEIDFDLDNGSPAAGILRKKCTGVIREMKKQLGSSVFDYVHAFVGDNFFDDLLAHSEVRETYKGWSEAQILRESYVGRNRAQNPIFEFGGIVFENYGEIDGEGVGIDTGEAQFFPVGVPGLFKTYMAPADYNETVNQLGRRLYAKQWPMPNDKGVNGELQMNALQMCTRPAALFGGKRT